jgi:cysteinyl-tRNA synthetase
MILKSFPAYMRKSLQDHEAGTRERAGTPPTLGAVFRIYDTRTGQAAPVEGARPGRLSTYLAGPAAGQTRLGDLRAAVVSDIIRRVAEQHRLQVTAWQHLPGGPADFGQLRAAWDDLNIYPLEFIQGPPDPLDVGVAAPGADAAHEALWVRPGDTSFIAAAVEIRETAGVSEATGAAPTPPGTSGTAESSRTPRTQPGTAGTAESSRTPRTPPEPSGTAESSLAPTDLTVRGLDPLALRFAFLTHHYRAPMVLAWQHLDAADQRLREWRKQVAGWARSPSQPMSAQYLRDVLAAFDDDLDAPAALDTLSKLIADDVVAPGSKFETFAYLDRLLGLDLAREVGY